MDDVKDIAESTDLIPALPTTKNALQVFTEPNGIEPYLEHVRKHVKDFSGDVTTKAGREEIASMAYKIARSKTALEGIGKALADRQKEIPKKIDAARKTVRETLDALRDKVRKPLDDWEATEKARVEKHGERLQQLADIARDANSDLSQEQLTDMLRLIGDLQQVDLEEYEAHYAANAEAARDAVRKALDARARRDQQEAELARLRQEQAEREAKEQAEREAREKAEREAREEQERKDHEARIAKEAEDRARREAEERAEQQRLEQERALQAERDRAAQAERDAAEAAERERKRIAAEQAAAAAEAERREKNRRHRAKIHATILEALTEKGIPAEHGKEAIIAIAKGEVPHVSIQY